MDATELLKLDIAAISESVRLGEVDARDLYRAAMDRVEEVNDGLNALVSHTDDRAREALAQLPDRIAGGDASLAGVPFVVTESLALRGAPHTSGSMHRVGEYAAQDATAVARLIQAGAIPIGVANTAEIAFWIETNNKVYGRGRSARNSGRVAGGASGSVAALIAAGCVPFGLGTDTVGSARVSAQSSGVVALKPTGGLVPLTGIQPRPAGRMRRFTVVAPLARKVGDLEVILDVIAGPDGEDGAAVAFERPPVSEYDVLWKRVVLCEDMNLPGIDVASATRDAVRTAVDILREQGGEVEMWRPQQFTEAFAIWLAMLQEGYGLVYNFADSIAGGRRRGLAREFAKLPLGRSKHTAPVLVMGLAGAVTRSSIVTMQRLSSEGRRLQERMNVLLQDGSALIMPVYPEALPKHGRSLRNPRRVAYTSIINAMELPSVSLPVHWGTGDDGPVNVQVVAQRGREDVCLAVAQLIEANLRPPPEPRLKRLARFVRRY